MTTVRKSNVHDDDVILMALMTKFYSGRRQLCFLSGQFDLVKDGKQNLPALASMPLDDTTVTNYLSHFNDEHQFRFSITLY
jgi:hypothetical protein